LEICDVRSKTQIRDSIKNEPKVRIRLSLRSTLTLAETERAKILTLLLAACGAWVSLAEIMTCAAQYIAHLQAAANGFQCREPHRAR
jgi:hypothetical protein